MKDKNNAIEITNMSKDFKRMYDRPNTLKEKMVFWDKTKSEVHHVLKNINLNIYKGETVALIGTNGSGKSTLLKLMTKILYPNKGSVETSGKLTSLLELGAGFHPDFTGRENIYFNASIFGLTRAEIDERIDEIIRFSELRDFIDNPVRTYSSGMYMRLAFSIAINVDAEILLLDEILAVGDQHFQDKCFAKLESLRDSDKTIVIVSHSLDSVKKICTRAVWIYKGEIKADGKTKEIISQYLAQISKDNPDRAPERLKTKSGKGLCLIDIPQNQQVISQSEKMLLVQGWEMSEEKDTTVLMYVDGKQCPNVERYERSKLIAHHKGMFGGAEANLLPGWRGYIDVGDLEVGEHIVDIQVLDSDENLISATEVTFCLE